MLWLQGLSDFLIGGSYMAIAGALAYLAYRARKDLPFEGMFLAFGLFIFSCGCVHFMEVWTLWQPVYWLSGVIKAVTAAASMGTAVGCFFLLPHVFGLVANTKASNQQRRELAKAHADLQRAYRRLEGEEARARLAAIVEYSEDAIISINLEAEVTSWNAAAEQLLGYRAEEMIGRPLRPIFPPEDRQWENTILEKLRRGESVRHCETVRIAKDGRRVQVALTVSPLRGPEGRIIGASGILRDITEQKRSEEQSRLQSAALQSAANAISITDRDGAIQWVNPAFEQLTGYSSAELVGQNHRLLKSGRQDAAFYKNLWDSIAAGWVWQGELVNKRKDGGLYSEEMTITPFTSTRGGISYFIAVKQDVTTRKQAEEALRQARDDLARHNADLERRVEERTSQLVEANANLQAFAYTAAHDLRAPLRGITNFSSIALEEYGPKIDETGRSMLERVIESAGQMSRLLTDLLEYSKLSGPELKLEHVSLQTAVSDALALLDIDIRGKNAAITVTDTLPEVIAHPATIVLLITNLVSNALKFISPEVPPQIRISAEQSGKWVRLSVQDNGIGIAPEDLERIFRAFERLHGKQAYPGTGLGLAIVRKGAERMGGRVGVDSEPGKGSRFWIELPPAEGHAPAPAPGGGSDRRGES
jgi:PAS domain S-box-containing protein